MTKKTINSTRIFKNINQFHKVILIQSIIAILWLLLIPKEPQNAVIFGYSLKRLALLIPILFLPLISITAFTAIQKKKRIQSCFKDKVKRENTARMMVISGSLLVLVVWVFAFFYHFLRLFEDTGAFIRLLPVFFLYLLVGLETILFVPLSLFRYKKASRKVNLSWNTPAFWISAALLTALLILITFTGLGKSPVWVSTNSLGVPLLEGQIWFVCGVLFLVMISTFSWLVIPGEKNNKLKKYQDVIIFFSLWLIALFLWMSLSLPEHNYFAPSVQPPNFEKYPFSDAEQYDYNSLYVYFGALDDFVVSKPLYVSFLTLLHFIGGFQYSAVVFLQTIVLAFLPAVIYLIGKELHSRLGGVGSALFVILREINSIQASTIANVSNSKLLLSDLPATLVVAIMVLVIIRWFKSSSKKFSHHIFIIGGLTAMLNLMRIQTLTLIPFIILLVIIRYFKQPKKILISCGIFILTVGILLAPTIIRNHSITGVYWIDNPSSSTALYSFFLTGSDVEIEVPEDVETSAEILDRNFTVIFSSFSENFGQMMLFMLDNFFRNLISTILIFPVRLGERVPLIEYVRFFNSFWSEVYGQINFLNISVILLNFLIISIGFSSTYKKVHKAAVMVLLVYVVYNMSSAVVRLSGWRFIQPVDWIVLIFYSVGAVEIIFWLFTRIFKRPFDDKKVLLWEANTQKAPMKWGRKSILLGVVFILSCAFIPLRELLVPSLYPHFERTSACAEISTLVEKSEYRNYSSDITSFCKQNNTRVFFGYGFYPRFFKIGQGFYDRSYDPFYGEQGYSRLVFRVIGQQNAKVYIKTKDSNVFFPNGEMVYVLQRDKVRSDAQLVIVKSEDPEVIISAVILEGMDSFSNK